MEVVPVAQEVGDGCKGGSTEGFSSISWSGNRLEIGIFMFRSNIKLSTGLVHIRGYHNMIWRIDIDWLSITRTGFWFVVHARRFCWFIVRVALRIWSWDEASCTVTRSMFFNIDTRCKAVRKTHSVWWQLLFWSWTCWHDIWIW